MICAVLTRVCKACFFSLTLGDCHTTETSEVFGITLLSLIRLYNHFSFHWVPATLKSNNHTRYYLLSDILFFLFFFFTGFTNVWTLALSLVWRYFVSSDSICPGFDPSLFTFLPLPKHTAGDSNHRNTKWLLKKNTHTHNSFSSSQNMCQQFSLELFLQE